MLCRLATRNELEDKRITRTESWRGGEPRQSDCDTREKFALPPHQAAKGRRDSLARDKPVNSCSAAVGHIRGRTRGVPASGGKELWFPFRTASRSFWFPPAGSYWCLRLGPGSESAWLCNPCT